MANLSTPLNSEPSVQTKIINFRVDASLRDAFNQATKKNNHNVSALFRTFMRNYIETHKA